MLRDTPGKDGNGALQHGGSLLKAGKPPHDRERPAPVPSALWLVSQLLAPTKEAPMTQTETSTAQIVQAYYDILTGGMAAYDPARLRALTNDNLVCS